MIPPVGTIVRDSLGSTRFVVVGTDARFVFVKRADTPKKRWVRAGSYEVAREEFEREWLTVEVAS